MQERDEEDKTSLTSEIDKQIQEHIKALETSPIAEVEVKDEDPDWSESELAEARENGYNPDDPKKLSPGEFNRRGPLFQHMKEIKQQAAKEMSELKKQLQEIKGQFTAQEQRGYERALKEIEHKRMQAVEIGDTQTFLELDKEREELQAAASQGNKTPPAQALSAEALEFQARNASWLNDTSAEAFAMQMDASQACAQANGLRSLQGQDRMTERQEARFIEDFVKLRYPHRFQNPAKDKPAAVERSSSTKIGSSSKGKLSATDLPAGGIRDGYHEIVKDSPEFTVEDYVNVLRKSGIRLSKGE